MERRPTSILTTLAVSVLALTLIAPRGLGQDPDRIAEIRRRAEQGDVDAQFTLGAIYSIGQIMFANGLRVGPESDAAEAAKWYRLAAGQGHATAQNNLAAMYAYGRGVPQDDAEAVRWYAIRHYGLPGSVFSGSFLCMIISLSCASGLATRPPHPTARPPPFPS